MNNRYLYNYEARALFDLNSVAIRKTKGPWRVIKYYIPNRESCVILCIDLECTNHHIRAKRQSRQGRGSGTKRKNDRPQEGDDVLIDSLEMALHLDRGIYLLQIFLLFGRKLFTACRQSILDSRNAAEPNDRTCHSLQLPR